MNLPHYRLREEPEVICYDGSITSTTQVNHISNFKSLSLLVNIL